MTRQLRLISYFFAIDYDVLWDITVAADLLDISPRRLRALMRQRRINFIKVGTQLRFRPMDLIDFLDPIKFTA